MLLAMAAVAAGRARLTMRLTRPPVRRSRSSSAGSRAKAAAKAAFESLPPGAADEALGREAAAALEEPALSVGVRAATAFRALRPWLPRASRLSRRRAAPPRTTSFSSSSLGSPSRSSPSSSSSPPPTSSASPLPWSAISSSRSASTSSPPASMGADDLPCRCRPRPPRDKSGGTSSTGGSSCLRSLPVARGSATLVSAGVFLLPTAAAASSMATVSFHPSSLK